MLYEPTQRRFQVSGEYDSSGHSRAFHIVCVDVPHPFEDVVDISGVMTIETRCANAYGVHHNRDTDRAADAITGATAINARSIDTSTYFEVVETRLFSDKLDQASHCGGSVQSR